MRVLKNSPRPNRLAASVNALTGRMIRRSARNPRADQSEKRDKTKLDIGGENVTIDVAEHCRLVDAHDQSRLRAYEPREGYRPCTVRRLKNIDPDSRSRLISR